ncbi:hypothetical protein [Parasediminibacterium sp. JCM 36343]|uniref:hypothetical protein n=1 Tax=Parasediminibacterium sp. JCM 36343 TaxID=3374279 RepID=UPI00397C0B29
MVLEVVWMPEAVDDLLRIIPYLTIEWGEKVTTEFELVLDAKLNVLLCSLPSARSQKLGSI